MKQASFHFLKKFRCVRDVVKNINHQKSSYAAIVKGHGFCRKAEIHAPHKHDIGCQYRWQPALQKAGTAPQFHQTPAARLGEFLNKRLR